LGTHDLNSRTKPPSREYKIDRVIAHSGYNDNSYLNDIALVILEEQVELNEYIQIACLPNPSANNYPTRTYINSVISILFQLIFNV
jgi:hypothetical protein